MPKRAFDQTDVFVGRRVRFFRLQKSWSQTDLAGHLDLTFQQVQKYEKGSNRIGAGRLSRIAELLGQPITAFYPDGAKPEQDQRLDQQVFEMVDSAQALRLLIAFTAIESPTARAALTKLAEEIGGTQALRKRRAA
jgi:transcriptional regulator with XRE-family HTH domain